MTTAAKTWVTIIVIIILAVLGWAWHSRSSDTMMPAPEGNTPEMPISQAQDDTMPSPSSNSDASDSGIDQDMASVNAQMSAIDSDSENANQ